MKRSHSTVADRVRCKLVEPGGFVGLEGTHFQATVNFTDDFMLVSK